MDRHEQYQPVYSGIESMRSTEQLAQLVEQKHALLAALRDLGLRQRELVEEEELSQLFVAFDQTATATLQTFERGLDPYRDGIPHRQWKAEDARASCAKLAAECPGLLQEVLALEAESEQRLRARRDLTETQLHFARSAVTARRAYVVSDHSPTGNLDLTSG